MVMNKVSIEAPSVPQFISNPYKLPISNAHLWRTAATLCSSAVCPLPRATGTLHTFRDASCKPLVVFAAVVYGTTELNIHIF